MTRTATGPVRAMLCVLAAGALAGAAPARPAAAAHPAVRPEVLQDGASGGAVLISGAGGLRLALGGGEPVTIAAPEGAAASAVAALDGGWAVAGSRPDGAGGRRLFVLRGRAGGRGRALAEPPRQRGSVRIDPVLLVDRGRLAGAAWLEGEPGQPLGVWAAALAGGRWSAPEPVAPPGPGSQLALAGAVLDDGSWLLVWSAFDGVDDEIVWARRLGGSWLPAARLGAGNAVPDVVPALAAIEGGGALAAWSRYDGEEYRLRLARFAGGAWRDLGWAGPPGSIFPSFAGGRERPWLLYRDAATRGWAVADVAAGAGALPGERRLAAATPSGRPALALEDGEPVLTWPGEPGRAGAPCELRLRPREEGGR